ncbi:TRAP transporter small permease subunit [Mesorhizobium xinjiangense]|uniref:TRAP transporter small permease subunit n=1 Tax=Mesorhizobium xinjiangense TaxID=2678685 RepID=UPI0012EEB82E|nr:TRAP transporter small permease subunit [Mesorhizobium xinjiangense]
MTILERFVRGVSWLNEKVGWLAAFLILPIFVLLLAEVFMRYGMASPTVWLGESAQMLFGAYALLSGGYLLLHRGHANVDILSSRLTPRRQAAVDIFTSVLTFCFLGAFLYFATSMAVESVGRMERSISAWKQPIWPLKLLIPIAAGLLLLQALAKLIEDVRIVLHGAPAQTASPTETIEKV